MTVLIKIILVLLFQSLSVFAAQFSPACIHLDIKHPIKNRILFINAYFEKDFVRSDTPESSLLLPSSDQNFSINEKPITTLIQIIEHAFREILKHPPTRQLLDNLYSLLERQGKFLFITIGKTLELIETPERLNELLEYLSHSIVDPRSRAHFIENYKKNMLLVVNEKELTESWVYTIKAKRNIDLGGTLGIHAYYLLVPTTQPSYMVILHELLHAIQALHGENSNVNELAECFCFSRLSKDLLERKIQELQKIWSNTGEVGAILGLKSYGPDHITELTIRAQLGIPIRVYHKGGLGIPDPKKSIYELCSCLETNFQSALSAQYLRDYHKILESIPIQLEADFYAMNKLRNWLSGQSATMFDSDAESFDSSVMRVSSDEKSNPSSVNSSISQQ